MNTCCMNETFEIVLRRLSSDMTPKKTKHLLLFHPNMYLQLGVLVCIWMKHPISNEDQCNVCHSDEATCRI